MDFVTQDGLSGGIPHRSSSSEMFTYLYSGYHKPNTVQYYPRDQPTALPMFSAGSMWFGFFLSHSLPVLVVEEIGWSATRVLRSRFLANIVSPGCGYELSACSG